ncbi:IS701 family transposase [Rhodococcus tibetensis]|uniref:IS701 family transposase n=1 Tax=Rhodococcus tibetensis TaxID=2965064 RepID=A0ABT1QIH1_9NOCA|nr:IS701 family transposase [Rhodococcus sp. FXJ9.536]MCQ4122089.1 IS701 family transposase [Rhodococcus sp. FXJ9.536]
MQRLLNFYSWDCEGLRDDVREVVVETIGDADKGVLIVDETGFLKKGTRSAGVAWQYSGTAGRIENSQIGVSLAYASDRGQGQNDRELYLPKAWIGDRDRCRAAGIADEVAFATKPELAQTMIERALDAGVPFGWFTGDEAYGQVGRLRLWLESRGVAHVLAAEEVADGDLDGVAPAPSPRRDRRPAGDRVAADQLRRRRPRTQVYDWAVVDIRPLRERGRGHWLLARRSITDPDEIAYYICYGPADTEPADFGRVAGSRWAIEECFQTTKNETGLDHYQVRGYPAWYRHITLSMATAFLTILRRGAQKRDLQPVPEI